MGSMATHFGVTNLTVSDMSKIVKKTISLVVVVAIMIFVFSYLFYALWNHLASNLSLKLRKIYLSALLK